MTIIIMMMMMMIRRIYCKINYFPDKGPPVGASAVLGVTITLIVALVVINVLLYMIRNRRQHTPQESASLPEPANHITVM